MSDYGIGYDVPELGIGSIRTGDVREIVFWNGSRGRWDRADGRGPAPREALASLRVHGTRRLSQRLSVSDEMVERAAEALIQDQTQGSCSLGKVCRECDCFATEDNGATRDGYARQHARAALRAALGSTE